MITKHLKTRNNHIPVIDYALKYKDSSSEKLSHEENENDQWMNRFSFDCRECEERKKFKTRKNLIFHLKSVHEMTSKEYSERHRQFSTLSIPYSCKICDTKVKWDSDAITSHLAQSHSMTPGMYAKCYHISNNLPESNPSSKNSKAGVANKQYSERNWNDRCTFSCQICYKAFHNRSLFKTHLKEKHSMSQSYYNDHFEAEMVQKTIHSCLICGREILFDSDSMKLHLQKCHSKIFTKTYEVEYFNKVALKNDTGENGWMQR
jgi:hypothetical protein